MALYDRIYQMLKQRTVTPDLVVYLQAARTGVLDGIASCKRARAPRRSRSAAEYVEEVARAYAEFFFFAYNDGPLLIVNASDIDFVGNLRNTGASSSRSFAKRLQHRTTGAAACTAATSRAGFAGLC